MSARILRRFALLLLALPLWAQAAVDAPDHVFYGNVSLFGGPAANGTLIEVRTHPGGVSLARYVLGRDARLGSQYALRIPMDVVDPRRPGYARNGDPVQIFVGPQLAAETSVGAEGIAVRLDLDPQNMGTGPGVTVAATSMFEGNAGVSAMAFPVSLNTTSPDPVQIEWTTLNGTATGGAACAPGVDFVQDSGMTEIAPGLLTGSIDVLICGDTQVEPDETFTLSLTRVVNGVAAQTQITGTILDDDNVPMILMDPARVSEPGSGSVPMVFTARLSRTAGADVQFTWATQNLEAQAGSDYIAANGELTIPAGELEGTIAVQVLADAQIEPPERFRLQLSNPVRAQLAQTSVTGIINDPRHTPVFEHEADVLGGPAGVVSLVRPSDVAVSPDGTHLYAVSELGDAVYVFARDGMGVLVFMQHYTSASPGFGAAHLDGARDIELSADGRFAYVAARGSNAINVFERDAGSGALNLLQVQINNQADAQAVGGTVRGLNRPSAIALAPDGGHLYVVSSTGNTLAGFARDAQSGQLRFVEVETNGVDDPGDAGPAVVALDRPSGVALSQDGRQVYVAARFGNAVLEFTRDADVDSPSYGKLVFRSAHRNGLLGVQGLQGAFALAVSPDDRHVYIVSEADNSVVLFDRAQDTGALSWRRQWRKGDLRIPGLGGAQAIRITADGEEVYVAGFADHSLTVFRRALSSTAAMQAGSLDPIQSMFDGDGANQEMAGPVAIAISPEQRNVYVAANLDNAIVRFGRLAVTTHIFKAGFE
jgi:DNA-binding beta-propeller fold protein YncE